MENAKQAKWKAKRFDNDEKDEMVCAYDTQHTHARAHIKRASENDTNIKNTWCAARRDVR